MIAERVLVVDDDEGLLNLMGLALRRRGYQVEQAPDGFSALKILASQQPFAVLLTDLMMPGMSGLELLREARKLDPHIEVVVVTAAPDLDSAISALRADGAYDYLLKPFESMSQLLLAVERAASQRRLLKEREELRVQIQHEAERLRALISNTGDAILSANASGTLQIVNPAASRLIGVENLEGTDAFQSLPTTLNTLIANWKAVGGNLPAVVETTWPDGTVQMVSLTPIPEEENTRWGWVAVLRDITHVKRMEELKSQLLVEAASRIRIPLAQAMNALVELNILTSQNERVSEVVFRLTQIWKRIQEWGDDLNALIRIDSGINLQSTNINLGVILDEVRQNQSGALSQATGITLNLTVEPDLPQVMADPELIRRLLNGLINRAVSRSEKGSAIHLYARNHNGQVWVSISDDGPAVSDADLPRIFEKSFVKTGAGPGVTGLEMALVKTIIDRMGGQVWVGGQGKRGSTIFVCLPTTNQSGQV
jgi:two-component system, OmpR family, phosphate regulon sensor histidine kinase PhoR